MLGLILSVVRSLLANFQARHQLVLENIALRHQLIVLKRTVPKARFKNTDRLLWLVLRAVWSRWRGALEIIRPETVVCWHRAGFRLYWRFRARGTGRPKIDRELARLIRRMWESPNISTTTIVRAPIADSTEIARFREQLKSPPWASLSSCRCSAVYIIATYARRPDPRWKCWGVLRATVIRWEISLKLLLSSARVLSS